MVKFFESSMEVKIAYQILDSCKNPKYYPLVLIQGLQGVKEDWLGLELELSKDRIVLIFDNRGMGESSVPQGPYSITQLAKDAIELIKHIGWPKIDLMGISMGGMISQMIVLIEPNLVNKLILGCTTYNAKELSTMNLKGKTKKDITREVVDLCLKKDFKFENPTKFNDFFEHTLKYRRPLKGSMAQILGITIFDITKTVNQISHKTLIIHGDLDRLIPIEKGQLLAKNISNSRFVLIKDCGHNFWWTHLEISLKHIVAFLNHDSSL